MAKLSDEETALLKKLTDKQKAPDAPPVGKSISATVDLGNPESVALAIKHGFLTADEVASDKSDDGDDGDGDSDETPARKGYFNS